MPDKIARYYKKMKPHNVNIKRNRIFQRSRCILNNKLKTYHNRQSKTNFEHTCHNNMLECDMNSKDYEFSVKYKRCDENCLRINMSEDIYKLSSKIKYDFTISSDDVTDIFIKNGKIRGAIKQTKEYSGECTGNENNIEVRSAIYFSDFVDDEYFNEVDIYKKRKL